MSRISWMAILLLFQIIAADNTALAQSGFADYNAPQDSLKLMDLKWSEKEVRDIDRLLHGKRFLYQDASEENFNHYATDAAIIHLATHALINDNAPLYSRLLFSGSVDSSTDDFLHTYELYNMQLNASLAVLSACNTGIGKLVSGEGIMSLARGFLYAGCPNVLMSLWPVDDQSTAQIMQRFYVGLKNGLTMDDALRTAKLAYLNEADDARSAPFYWANFVLIGEANPIKFRRSSNVVLFALLGFVFILSLTILLRKKLSPAKTWKTAIMSLAMIATVFWLCHLFNFISFGQTMNDRPDSLAGLVNDDYAKAKNFLQRGQFDSSIFYFQKTGANFQKGQNWEAYFKCLIHISENYRQKRDYNRALDFLNQASEISAKLPDRQQMLSAQLFNSYGNVYRKERSLDTSYHYFRKALDVIQYSETSDSTELANSYHGIGVVKYFQGKFDSSSIYHQKALAIRLEKLGVRHSLVADSYVNLGLVASATGDFEKSLDYHLKGMEIRTEILGDVHPDMANSYLNLGVLYNEKGDYDRSLPCFQKGLDIAIKTIGEKNSFVAGCYLNIGLVFDKKGDYEKALEFYNKSLSLMLEISDEPDPMLAEIYNNMGIVHKKKENYVKALELYRNALNINLKQTGENHPNVIKLYMNIANVYSLKSEFDTAIEYYQKSLAIARQIFSEDSPLVAYIYHNIGTAKSNNSNFEDAQCFLVRALSIGLKILGEKHPFISEVYFELGENFNRQNDPDNALHYYQSAILALVSDFDNQNIYINPPLKNISEEIRLLSVLEKKALTLETLYFERTKNIKDLTFALLTYDLAIQLVDKISKSYKAEGSKLFLRESAHDIYGKATEIAYDLYQLTAQDEYKHKAFFFAEKSKARVLQLALLDIKAKKFGGIPDSLLEKERQLKMDLAFYDEKIFKEIESVGAADSAKITFWRDKLFSLNREYESLIALFENQYPGYFKLKYQSTVVSPGFLQDKIANENSTIIEYLITDDAIFTFILTRASFDVMSIKKDSLFESKIKDMLSALKEKNHSVYTSTAKDLFRLLIAPVETKIVTPKLVIIPDGLSGYLPFEVLLTENVSDDQQDYRTLPYLINSYQISYHYSASLLYEALANQDDRPAKLNFVGFAPVRFYTY